MKRLPARLLIGALQLLCGSTLAQTNGPAPQARLPSAADDLTLLVAQPQRCGDAASVYEAGPLRLAAVLRAVICNDPGVRRGLGLSTQAQASADLVQAQSLPSLNLSAGADAERGSAAAWGAALNLQWVLFDFGRRNADSVQANQALSAVLDEQRGEVLNAVGNAALLYTAAQAALGRLDASSVNLRTAMESARVSEARRGAGASTLNETLQAKTAQAQAQLERARAKGQWLSARGALAVAMRLPADAPLQFALKDFTDEAMLESTVDINALVEEARAKHPRVQAARARLALAMARADSVGAERWGRVALTANSGRSRPAYGSQAQTTGSAQLSWSIPIFDGGLLKARKSDAQGQVQTSQVAMDDASSQIELQVWQRAQALISERDMHRDSKLVLENADTALRVASERFRLGVGNFSDVLIAQNSAATARFQLVESQANVLREQLRLAAAVGRFGLLLRF
jgi:outer membrane protein